MSDIHFIFLCTCIRIVDNISIFYVHLQNEIAAVPSIIYVYYIVMFKVIENICTNGVKNLLCFAKVLIIIGNDDCLSRGFETHFGDFIATEPKRHILSLVVSSSYL